MAGAITILHEVHRLRRHIKGLQESIERAPRLVKARQQALLRLEEELKAAGDELHKTKVVTRQQESTLKEVQQQIKQVSAACEPDVEKFCFETPMGKGAIAKCLKSNEANLSPDCKSAIEQAKTKSKKK